MATARVDFTVKPGPGVQAYWIAVGDDDVNLTNGRGSLQLESGRRAVLLWWFLGNPGSKLAITGKVGTRTIVEVKASQIPAGELEGAGRKRFTP